MKLLNSNKNIILTGMPGSGKSTIGKKLAHQTGYNFSDFDDDVLEKITLETSEEALYVLNLREQNLTPEDLNDKKVSHLLDLLGDEKFLELEGFIGENLHFEEQTVISTSGSIPLEINAMDNLKKDGKVIYINTPIESILARLHRMKTDRIIGMGKMTLEEILEHRENYYKKTLDFSFDTELVEKISKEKDLSVNSEKDAIFKEFMNYIKTI